MKKAAAQHSVSWFELFLESFLSAGYSGEIKERTLLETIPKWGPEFYISLEVFFNSFSGAEWCSVVHFSDSGYDKWPVPFGWRVPGVWTRKSTSELYISTQIDGDLGGYSHDIATETWYRIEMEQKKNHKGEVKYK